VTAATTLPSGRHSDGNSWRSWVTTTALAAVVGLAYGPLVVEHFANLWLKPHYQYYPFALAAFAVLLSLRLSEATPHTESSTAMRRLAVLGVAALGSISWLLLAAGHYAHRPWLAAISAVTLLGAVFVRIGRSWFVPGLWGVWCILWLVIPPPMNREQFLINRLQRLSSRVSSLILDGLGVLHLMEGNTFTLVGKRLFVDEACSGIISVMSLAACALIYGVWLRRPALQVVLLALSGIFWAVATNVARIVVIALAYDWYGVDWSAGTSHETLSLAVFTVAFLGLVSTDYLLSALLAPVQRRWGEMTGSTVHFGYWPAVAWDACVRTPNSTTLSRSWVADERSVRGEVLRSALGGRPSKWIAIACFAILAAGQAYYLWDRTLDGSVSVRLASLDRAPQALALDESTLPTTFEQFNRVSFEREDHDRGNVFGDHSLIYKYQVPAGQVALVSCSFPFYEEWHDLTYCYAGIGWSVDEQRVLPLMAFRDASNNAGAEAEAMEATFKRPDGSVAYLVYTYFDAAGNWADPPQSGLAAEALRSFRKRDSVVVADQRYQVQVLVVSGRPISEDQRQGAQRLLFRAGEQLRVAICGIDIDGSSVSVDQSTILQRKPANGSAEVELNPAKSRSSATQ
jgi:exosortase